MHEWLRDFFWLFPLIMFPVALSTVIISAIIMPLVSSRLQRGLKRIVACLGASLISLVPSGLLGYIWLMGYSAEPILRHALHMMLTTFTLTIPRFAASVFFYWVPALAMLAYNAKVGKPKIVVTLLIGIIAAFIGLWLVYHIGLSLGASTD